MRRKKAREAGKEYDLNPNLIRKWQMTFLEKVSSFFEATDKEAAKTKQKEESLEKKQKQMLSTIGQLTLERDFLQDAFRLTERPVPKFVPDAE